MLTHEEQSMANEGLGVSRRLDPLRRSVRNRRRYWLRRPDIRLASGISVISNRCFPLFQAAENSRFKIKIDHVARPVKTRRWDRSEIPSFGNAIERLLFTRRALLGRTR